MSLVPAKCTSCGAALIVDDSLESAYCAYCGVKYLVRAGIAFNKVEIQGTVQTRTADYVVKAGKLESYNGASVDISIPEGVIEIGDGVFKSCRNIKSVLIPEGVVEIGGGAFNSCTKLESISLPDSLTTISYGAFSGCKNLKSVELGSGLREIGNEAFHGCDSLKKITVRGESINKGECFVFPPNFNHLNASVFSSMPREIVFLCKDDIFCDALSAYPRTDYDYNILREGTDYHFKPFIEDRNCSYDSIYITQKNCCNRPKLYFKSYYYKETKPWRRSNGQVETEYNPNSKSFRQELIMENYRWSCSFDNINRVFYARKSNADPVSQVDLERKGDPSVIRVLFTESQTSINKLPK